jgi:hypothetical protein
LPGSVSAVQSNTFVFTTLLLSPAIVLPACFDGSDSDLAPAEAPAASASTAAVTAAFPASTMITGLVWNFTGRVQLAVGSDLWPLTQTSDGAMFGGWGDGGGFTGDNTRGRVSIGFGKMTGTPPSLTGTNLWGSSPSFAQNPATFCGKPEGTISVGGTIYVWVGSSFNDSANDFFRCAANPSPTQTRLASSTDGGKHFTEASFVIAHTPGAIHPNAFINFGRDNAGARDGFVYFTGGKTTDAAEHEDGQLYLIRTTPANVATMSTWQYFTGLDANTKPIWGTAAAARGVFADPDFGGGQLTYHPATNRYLLTSQGATIADYALYEGPQPWGPWSKVFATHTWGPSGAPFGTGESLGISYPEAWMSADGKTIWAAFSSGPPSSVGDALNLMSATLTLANQGVTIKTPTAYAQTKAAVNNPLYTDRPYTVNTLSANLDGGELIQLANDDKASTAATQVQFTITNAQTVYVAIDATIAPVPSWLSTWTRDTASVFKWNNADSTVVTFNVYKKAFAAGSTVSLPGNLNGTTGSAHSNYTVIVH